MARSASSRWSPAASCRSRTTSGVGCSGIPRRYAIDGVLGHGGAGIVFAARDGKSGRRVALKILRPQFAGDPAAIARFTREVQPLIDALGEDTYRAALAQEAFRARD